MVVGKNNENDIDKFNKINYRIRDNSYNKNFMNIGRGIKVILDILMMNLILDIFVKMII